MCYNADNSWVILTLDNIHFRIDCHEFYSVRPQLLSCYSTFNTLKLKNIKISIIRLADHIIEHLTLGASMLEGESYFIPNF